MFGITFFGLLRFGVQLGLALAGAASLWGWVMSRRARGAQDEKGEAFTRMARFLMGWFVLGTVLFVGAWLLLALLVFSPEAQAHEGITIRNIAEGFIRQGILINAVFVAGIAAFALFGLRLLSKTRGRRDEFLSRAPKYFSVQFVLVSVIMFFTVWTGSLGREQIFFFFHNWHSIFTLATVLTVDALFLATLSSDALRRALYPFFPLMSKVIWTGLGIDFLTNMLIYQDHWVRDDQFFFLQTVIGILVINGTLLSGRINEALVRLIRPDGTVGRLSGPVLHIVHFSGAISIISWLTITFVDFFVLPFSYAALLGGYLALIPLAYIGSSVGERMMMSLLPARARKQPRRQ